MQFVVTKSLIFLHWYMFFKTFGKEATSLTNEVTTVEFCSPKFSPYPVFRNMGIGSGHTVNILII